MLIGCGDDSKSNQLGDAADAADTTQGLEGLADGTQDDGETGEDGTALPDVSDPDAEDTAADGTAGSEAETALTDVTGDPAGTPCVDDDACRSGWCVPSAIGQVCVDICFDTCDAGEACIPAADAGTDPISLCVPIVAPPDTDTVGGETIDATSDASDDGTIADDATIGDATPDDAIIDDTAGDDATTTDAGPGPDVPDDETIGGDSDGDGIPDDVDNLPCLAVYLVVYNQNVTSASIVLNGSEVVSANSFPTSAPIQIPINPTTGENTLALGGKLTGSPSDTLTLVVMDSDGHVYFATVIAREPGKPVDQTFTFMIDVTCP